MRRSSFRDSSFVVRRSSFVVSRSSFVVRRSSFFSRQLLIVRSSVVDHKQKHTAFSPTLFSRGSFSPRFSCRPPTQVRLGPFISDMMRWHSHHFLPHLQMTIRGGRSSGLVSPTPDHRPRLYMYERPHVYLLFDRPHVLLSTTTPASVHPPPRRDLQRGLVHNVDCSDDTFVVPSNIHLCRSSTRH